MRKKETFLSGNNHICELFTVIELICTSLFNVDLDPVLKHAGRNWGQISETKSRSLSPPLEARAVHWTRNNGLFMPVLFSVHFSLHSM